MTEQEQQELEMLRKEKRQRTQQQRAQAALETAGVPASFAALLAEMNQPVNAAGGVGVFLRLSNFSHAQLCRLTRKYLGMTPRDYVNTVRMKYAWELVVSSEESYEAICEAVGFSSFSYFCRLFVKTYGITPARARKSRSPGARTI